VIDRREILATAANLGLPPNIVEKDYVLGWLLAGIYAHEAIGGSWRFKGGTCLKKCYFETYRFSEDLDFTLTDKVHLEQDFLLEAFRDISGWVYDRTGIEMPPDRLRFDIFANKRGQPACEGRISYRGPIAPAGDLPRIKLDLTADEVPVLPPAERRVAHPYSDEPEGGITALCYAYEEAFAEKVRALGERARPRDLYDVISLYRHDEIQPDAALILDVLRQKCAFKGIPLPTVAALGAVREELAGDWPVMLGHQLPALPPLDHFWAELPAVFSWIEGGKKPPMPAAYPLAPGDVLIRERVGGLSIPGVTSTAPLEAIRFAAASRLCVELDYTDESGHRAVRIIEPYSLRRTEAGDILLHAERADGRGHRSYRADRINHARPTSQSFSPRYAVELTPAGPVSAPLSSPAPRLTTYKPAPRSTPRFSRAAKPTHIYECSVCGKRFERKTHDVTLRQHKDKSGWPCSGRHGVYVDTKY
jgi:predicted nucleotidyltransferase component of viral defense system